MMFKQKKQWWGIKLKVNHGLVFVFLIEKLINCDHICGEEAEEEVQRCRETNHLTEEQSELVG